MAENKKLVNVDQLKLLAERVKTEDGKVTSALEAKISALKTSDLNNDKKFQTQEEVAASIAGANHLQYKKVESKDEIAPESPGADKYIYLVPQEPGSEENGYDEYMVIESKLEKVGDWAVDLSGYVKNDALTEQLTQYVKTESLTTTLADYVKSATLTSTLEGYVQSTALDTKLEDYVQQSSLTTTLQDYVKTTELEEKGYLTEDSLTDYVKTENMTTELAKKVDKVEGKDLSTNDYTTAEKTKLAGLEVAGDEEVTAMLKEVFEPSEAA